ncbi:MAG: type I pullulanase [Candidatus Sumerlaeia bacterium]|nr:type I pullulanase [Candidatus Sumerlaeia bacterium]
MAKLQGKTGGQRFAQSVQAPLFTGLLVLAGCAVPGINVGEQPQQLPEITNPGKVTIHYHRFDGNQEHATIWTWDANHQRTPDDQELHPAGTTDFGVYFTLDTTLYGEGGGDDQRIGFIPRLYEDWNRKDGSDRFWSPTMGSEIWLIGNDMTIYRERPDVSPRVALAWIDSSNEVVALLSHPMETSAAIPEAFVIRGMESDTTIPVEAVRFRDAHNNQVTNLLLRTSQEMDILEEGYTVEADGFQPRQATPRLVLDDHDNFHTTKPLGAIYSPESTTFRIFSPIIEEATVVLFDNPTGQAGREEHPMSRAEQGTWEVTVPGDLEGRHYRLRVTSPHSGTFEVNDPWATNTTGDDGNARITDIRALDPPNFRPIKRPEYGNAPTDAVIYEIHIRDFTIDESSGVDPDKRGTYLGFVQEGTTIPGTEIATGLDHLKELGVTHIQILPFQDFDNQESNPEYNWGYMTAFFNAPEGWFASDFRTEARVRELKQMIQGIKEAGFGVILDVVYNHTGTQNTFEQISPVYFHRRRDDGSFWNGSGTGNEFRSEAPMGRQFIIDSCKFWVEEYGVDGFRFDLMGLIDLPTMVELQKELYAIDPDILLYGEPWAATGPEGSGLDRLTWKDAVSGTGIGAFNDHFRNAIKGPPDGGEPGYVQDGRNRGGVISGIAGSIDDWAANPTESIVYVTCHDNLTLWDKYLESVPHASDADRRKMQKLAMGIMGVSQGVLFFHGGAEMARTKGGNHNSYNAGDEVNLIDWNRKVEFAEIVDYYAGVVEFRRSHPVLRLRTADDVRQRIHFHNDKLPAPQAIVFSLDGSGMDDERLATLAAFINPLDRDLEFDTSVVEGGRLYIHDDQAGTSAIDEVGGTLVVPARTISVVGVPKE